MNDISTLQVKLMQSVQFKGLEQTKELYAVLFQPIAGIATKSRLTVVADGQLHLLPFDALVDDQGRYVVHSHVVSYSPSATVLSVLRGLVFQRAVPPLKLPAPKNSADLPLGMLSERQFGAYRQHVLDQLRKLGYMPG